MTPGHAPDLVERRRRDALAAMGIDRYVLRSSPAEDAACNSEIAVEDPAPDWQALQEKVRTCTACALHKTRTHTVFGVGNPDADWMIIGEAPGQEEDRRGEPFVGRAGGLLDEMLRATGLDRESVFIANILKCRPPNNRDPLPAETQSCRHFLDQQIARVAPKIILAVGRIAAQLLLDSDAPLGRLRQQKHYLFDGQLPVVVTYHPAYLLRSPAQKRKAWQDLCLARTIVRESGQ